jgi:2-polyprenyl-3-methyl-5-hydroxy-6-metoxy-1,4-benzoquinol methylase
MSSTDYLHRQTDGDHLQWVLASGFQDFKGKKVLDLGCAGGAFLRKAQSLGAATCFGVDLVPGKVTGIDIIQGNLDESKVFADIASRFGERSFDLVCGFDLIEHLISPALFIQWVKPLIGNQGSLMITTPNVSSWERWLRPKTWSGAADQHHKTLFNSYTLGLLIERTGYDIAWSAAPIRKLGPLATVMPQIGGQLAIRAVNKSR